MSIDEIIERLVSEIEPDTDPNLVRAITIDNRVITVEKFVPNENGRKFIKEDGTVATETSTYPHRAFWDRQPA